MHRVINKQNIKMNIAEILIWTHLPYTILLIVLLFVLYGLKKDLKRVR